MHLYLVNKNSCNASYNESFYPFGKMLMVSNPKFRESSDIIQPHLHKLKRLAWNFSDEPSAIWVEACPVFDCWKGLRDPTCSHDQQSGISLDLQILKSMCFDWKVAYSRIVIIIITVCRREWKTKSYLRGMEYPGCQGINCNKCKQLQSGKTYFLVGLCF